MGWISIVFALIIAGLITSSLPRVRKSMRGMVVAAAVAVVLVGIALSSVRYVSADRVGIVTKNALGTSLSQGQIIATEGEMGVQADVLYPGWQLWYWPVVYNVDLVPLTVVDKGRVGLVESTDGRVLSEAQVFADEVSQAEFERMIKDPRYFLSEGAGQKGPQTTVLTPGSYRLNTRIYKVSFVDQTDVLPGMVGVIKSNVGSEPTLQVEIPGGDGQTLYLADEGEKGVRAKPLEPGAYPINPAAFEVHAVSTERRVANYTAGARGNSEVLGSITVKSKDAFNFPVDVRVVYYIRKEDAPRVVALLGGDNQKLQQLLTSRVRAIFRDNAESVSALDYIEQRSKQAERAGSMLRTAMKPYGITIESIDIGEVGNEETLGELLKTQRDRKIAEEQKKTFEVQQAAAEQEKALKRTIQEVEEEMRLATARYEVQIAGQQKEQRIIAAEAEAKSIEIRANAQAEAFKMIAEQIGPQNAALMELLSIVGKNAINITPRVMVSGSAGSADAETTALIGTMLDSMTSVPVSGSATGGK